MLPSGRLQDFPDPTTKLPQHFIFFVQQENIFFTCTYLSYRRKSHLLLLLVPFEQFAEV